MAAAHAAFWIWVAPVNASMVLLDSPPQDWSELRNQWEQPVGVRPRCARGLQIAALAALVTSILEARPAD